MRDNRFKLPPPVGKEGKWRCVADTMLASKYASRSDSGELIGKLRFAQLQVFYRFGRCVLRPLNKKLPPKTYKPALGCDIAKALKWWKRALNTSASRAIGLPDDEIDFAIYADAPCGPINRVPQFRF